MRTVAAALLVTAVAVLAAAPAPAAEQDRVRWQGKMRNIAIHEPGRAQGAMPLLVVMGQPGRSARYALESWRELADLESFVVAAVSSDRPDEWHAPQDGPGLLLAVVRRVAARCEIDRRRVYLFGAGAGGGFALLMGSLQPEYFAAVAGFGGPPPQGALGRPLARALPVQIYYSKRTPQFDVDALRQAAADLRGAGAEVAVERLDVSPDFERKGRKVAARIWAALEAHALSEPSRYRSTPFDR